MSLYEINIFTGATLILLAARAFGVSEFSWLTILTPAILGEVLSIFITIAHTRMVNQRKKAATEDLLKVIRRVGSDKSPTDQP
jgi:hypothetical protein